MFQRNPDMIFALVNASASKKKFEQRPEYQKLRAYLKYNPGQLNIFPNFDRILKRMLRQPGVVSICSVQGCKALRKKYPDLTCWPDKGQPEIITHYFVRKSDCWLANFLTKTALYLEEHGLNNYLKRAYGFGKAGEKLVAYWNSYRSISLGTLKSALTTMSFLVVGNFVFCLCCDVVYSNVRKSCWNINCILTYLAVICLALLLHFAGIAFKRGQHCYIKKGLLLLQFIPPIN